MNVKYFLEDEIIENYFESTVLKRTISGIQSIKTTVEAKGKQYQTDSIDTNTQIDLIRNRTAKIEKSIDGLSIEFKDFENDTRTKFEQTADSISSKVSKGNVSSEISQEHDKVKITGNRLVVESDNFNLDESGALVLGGNLTSYNAIKLSSYGNGFNVIESDQYAENNKLYIRGLDNDIFLTYVGKYSGGEEPETVIINKKTYIAGDFKCSGTKSRTVKTKTYSDRLQYCYEMASPMFGDIGHGVVGNDGLCYVDIDSIFAETIDTIQKYYVFLQPYSDKPLFVKEKTENYFVVCGEPNAEFDWEIKAKQSDFPMERLEENSNDEFSDIDYVSSAETYLKNYEKELTV